MASGPRQPGLTLVEVLLVLALLVVISAVSVPLLEGSFARAGLQNSGDLLRGAWSRARIAAMESGETHVFRYEQFGSRYQITTLNALSTPEGDPPSEDPEDQERRRDPSDLMRLSEDRLPDGILFAGGDIASSSQVAATIGQLPAGDWSAPILFHADGTTSDATVVLINEREQTIRVTLRGLTGISNTAEVGREALPAQ
jgi:prepilin-type N-terminal cleavage/methylation domain-containing protein